MKKFPTLVLTLSCVAACGSADTDKPVPPRRNLAIETVMSADRTAQCSDWGVGKDGADVGLCLTGGTLVRCRASVDVDIECKAPFGPGKKTEGPPPPPSAPSSSPAPAPLENPAGK